jgi:hypothetical protein
MDSFKISADGVTIEMYRDEDGDVQMDTDAGEGLIISKPTARIIGLALVQLATDEE